jgi:hypothetical protein
VGVKHIRWENDPPVHEPVVIAAFAGWNDAGDAATGAVRYLVDHFDADLVAELDPEEFFDFTSTRPTCRSTTTVSAASSGPRPRSTR